MPSETVREQLIGHVVFIWLILWLLIVCKDAHSDSEGTYYVF
jgi:hypothetical protein